MGNVNSDFLLYSTEPFHKEGETQNLFSQQRCEKPRFLKTYELIGQFMNPVPVKSVIFAANGTVLLSIVIGRILFVSDVLLRTEQPVVSVYTNFHQ